MIHKQKEYLRFDESSMLTSNKYVFIKNMKELREYVVTGKVVKQIKMIEGRQTFSDLIFMSMSYSMFKAGEVHGNLCHYSIFS